MPQRLGRIPGASELPGEALCRHRQPLPSFHAAVTVGAEGGIMPRGTKMGALEACDSKTFASAPKTVHRGHCAGRWWSLGHSQRAGCCSGPRSDRRGLVTNPNAAAYRIHLRQALAAWRRRPEHQPTDRSHSTPPNLFCAVDAAASGSPRRPPGPIHCAR